MAVGALFLAAFKLLTVKNVSLGQLLPGAVVAALAFEVLQAVGGYYLGHTLKGASQTYGFLGTVTSTSRRGKREKNE